MKTLVSRSRGFTLIELLIVIAIIAILSGIVITDLAGSRAKSRDGQRVSDISQIQLALEQYFDRCQQYPILAGNGTVISSLTASQLSGINNGCPSGISLGTFITQMPTPPTGTYDYYNNASAQAPTDYILHTQLETNAAALGDSILDINKPYWVSFVQLPPGQSIVCYTAGGSAPYNYCIGSH